MVRVLHIFHEMSNGGNCHFIMNYYRHMDRTKVQFDFLTSVAEPGYFDEEILKLGGKLFHAYPFSKNPLRNYRDIAGIVRENHYQIVHRHTGSAFGYFELRAARRGGAKHLILHAHNTDVGKPLIHHLALLMQIDCHRYACSRDAGEFLFGKKKAFEVIRNAVDVEKMAYAPDTRAEMRKALGIEDKLVFGHIGRMEEQKNHKRLIPLFAQLHQQRKDAALVCVGDGSLMEEVKTLAHSLGVENDVLFLGQRSDVKDVIQAFDAFLLPSLYEGFPVTLVEAQAAGLSCFVAKDAVPKETNITGNVHFIPLTDSDKAWAEQILGADLKRNANAADMVRKAGFDIRLEAEELTRRYLAMAAEQ